ncbi:MAG: choice-of-anchor D domain-containing protein [Acidobacteriaceae bacterium]
MKNQHVASSCDRSTAAGRASARRQTSPAFAMVARAAFRHNLRRIVPVLALAGLLPLSGFAQRHGGHSTVALSAFTCNQSMLTAVVIDPCKVTLSAAAGSGGVTVSVSDNNTAIRVPASVVVPSGATAAGFAVNSSAVTSAQSVTLTASEGGVSKTYVVTLNPVAAMAAGLTVNSTSVAFGTVAENATATQSVTLTSSGTAPVTLESATISGKGFGVAGMSFPVTLSPRQSAVLDLQFDPTAAGAAAGTVTISSSAANGAAVISLSGTGEASSSSYGVELSWEAPASSTDPVAGYHIYRATGSSGSYQLLNASVNPPTTYTDTTAQSGTTYNYKVTSVDAEGAESTASNVYTAALP